MRYLVIALGVISFFKSGVFASETKHIYECPIKAICELMISHYRTDPSKRAIFTPYEDAKIILSEHEKTRRIRRGDMFVNSSYQVGSSGNVITLYDGIGFQNEETESNFSFGQYNLNFLIDLRPRSQIVEPHQVKLENMLNNARRSIFMDLMQVFPRFSINGDSTSRRSLFQYIHQLDIIKTSSEVLGNIKRDYKKVLGLYKKKILTLDSVVRASDLITRLSSRLFNAQSRKDWYFPTEFRLKKKLDLLKSIIEKKQDLIIAEEMSRSSEEAKVCSLVEFIERSEYVELESLRLEFESIDNRLGFTYQDGLSITANGDLGEPSSLNTSILFGVNYRLIDSTENYIARILFRNNKKRISEQFSDLKVQEFERVQTEAQSYYQVKEHFSNEKFVFEQNKILKKGLIRGSVYKGNIRVRNDGIVAKNELILELMDREDRFRSVKSTFLSNLFRLKASCLIVDETVKDI